MHWSSSARSGQAAMQCNDQTMFRTAGTTDCGRGYARHDARHAEAVDVTPHIQSPSPSRSPSRSL
jgi:hypothetical protein